MSLRVQAEADLASTLEAPGDFGFPFTLQDPAGTVNTGTLYGMTGDVGASIDPETGQLVSGRHATLTARIASILAAGFTELPRGVAAQSASAVSTVSAWRVTFDDINGNAQLWKVKHSMPDRTLGLVHMDLEFWRAA